MIPLNINAIPEETPVINLNPKEEIFEIEGDLICYYEQAIIFVQKVTRWFKNYSLNPNSNTQVSFKLYRVSDIGMEFITSIFDILNTIPNVSIIWYQIEDDEDVMEEYRDELKSLTHLPIKFEII